MTKLNDSPTMLDRFNSVKDSITSFGIGTIMKAVMVPPTLCNPSGKRDDEGTVFPLFSS